MAIVLSFMFSKQNVFLLKNCCTVIYVHQCKKCLRVIWTINSYSQWIPKVTKITMDTSIKGGFSKLILAKNQIWACQKMAKKEDILYGWSLILHSRIHRLIGLAEQWLGEHAFRGFLRKNKFWRVSSRTHQLKKLDIWY